MELTTENIFSLVALLIALSSTVINYVLLRLHRDPEVVVYALPDTRRPTIINLVIENTGRGIAQDVTFESNRTIPSRAFGIDNAPEPESMSDGPFVTGIPSFGPGDKRIITWGQYGGLKKGLEDDVLEINAIYFSKPPLSIRRQRHKTLSSIDLRSFGGTDASDQNWDKQMAKHLENIANTLNRLVDTEQVRKGKI